MKKGLKYVFLFVFAVLILVGCKAKEISCELTTTETATSISYELNFSGDVDSFSNYKIVLSEKQDIVAKEIKAINITAGEFSNLKPNTEYSLNVLVAPKNDDYNTNIASKTVLTKKMTFTNVTLEDAEFTYDGQAKSIAVKGAPTDATITYTGNDVTDVGTHEVIAKVSKPNYEDLTLKANITIKKANYDLSDIAMADKTVDYTGEAQELNITGTLPTGVTVAYEYYQGETKLDTAPINAGTYTVKAIFTADTTNHNPIEAKTATLTISKIDIDMTSVAMTDKTVDYTGEAQELSITGTLPTGVTVAYEYYQGETKLDAAPINAGTYTVKAVFTADTINHNTIEAKTATLTISKIDVTLSAENISVQIGEAYDVSWTCSLENVNDLIEIEYKDNNDNSIEKPTSVGSYQAIVKFLGNDNYNAKSVTISIQIKNPDFDDVMITLTDISVAYGTAYSIEPTTDQGNKISNSELIITIYDSEDKKCETNPTNVGTYKISVTYEGNESEKLNAAYTTATLTITKADVDMSGVTMVDKTITYTGEAQELIITDALPTGVTVTYEYYQGETKLDTAPTNAGTYTVKAIFTVDTTNYNPVEAKTATLTVTKAYVDMSGVTMVDTTVTYTGEAQELIITDALPTGVTVAYEYYQGETKLDTVPTNAGTYTVKAIFTIDTTNYNPVEAKTATLTIDKADFDLSKTQMGYETYNKKIHNGSLYNSPDKSIVASFRFYSDEARTNEVTDPINAGTYYVVASFTHTNQNYNAIPDNNSLVMVIKPKNVYLDWAAESSFVYDGKTSHTLSATIAGGVIDGDIVTVLCSCTTESPMRVGKYVYTAVLEGTDSANYIISERDVEKVLTISAPMTNSSTATDLSTIADGNYAIVATNGTEYFALTNQITKIDTVKTSNCSTFTSVDDFDFKSTDVWTITNVTGGITIKTGDKYLSPNTSGTKIQLLDTEVIWTISNGFITSGGDRYLLYNGSGSASAFGYYTLTSSDELNSGYANISFYSVTEETAVNMNVVEPETTDGTVEWLSSTGTLSGLYSVDTVTLTITPVAGKMVKSVKVGDASLSATKNENGTYTCDLNGNVGGDIVVVFADALAEHNVTVVSDSGEVNGVHASYYEGETIIFTITPVADKFVKNVTVTDASGTITINNDNGEFSFVLGTSDATITVEYGNIVALTFESSEFGQTILYTESEANPIASGTKVNEETTINVKANPVAGYIVDQIFVNDVELSGTSFVLNGATNVRITYKLMDITSAEAFAALTSTDVGNKYLVMGKLTTVNTPNSYIEDLNDSSKTILLYGYNTGGFVVGDIVLVHGEFKIYNDTYELVDLTIVDTIKPVTNIGYSDTKLVWSSDSTTHTYNVYKDDTKVASNLTVKELDLTSLGLTAGTTYTWKIEAISSKTGIKSETSVSLAYGAKYTLTYNYNYDGSTNTVVNDLTALPSELLVPTAREGFEFVGWFTDAECKNEAVAGTPLTANIELFAKWKNAGETTYTFSDYSAGTQYKADEVHKLDDNITITTTQCHFTTELRIYSSSTHNGFAIIECTTGVISALSLNAGYKNDSIVVYGSNDGENFTEVTEVAITTTYNDYSVNLGGASYKYIKLDVKGTNAVRIKSMVVTVETKN